MTVFVLDSGAIIFGVDLKGAVTTNLIIDEVKSRNATWNLETLENDGLEVLTPKSEWLKKAREGAKGSGDLRKLSKADISIIALALELDGIILTDDYAVQNVASILSLKCLPVEKEKIGKVLKWEWLCKKCKKKLESEDECPICGGTAYRRVVRPRL
ncbi:MAG TPA: ribonuclease VapC [Euryarchaeota archaeon]|nr:ribonuclease VapC [Euryarchaeota archaeon]